MNKAELNKHLKAGVDAFAIYPQREPGDYVPAEVEASRLIRAVVVEDGVEWERTVRSYGGWSSTSRTEKLSSGVRVLVDDETEQRIIERRAVVRPWAENEAILSAKRERENAASIAEARLDAVAGVLGGRRQGRKVELSLSEAEALAALLPTGLKGGVSDVG